MNLNNFSNMGHIMSMENTWQAANHKHTHIQLNETFFQLPLLTDNWRNKCSTPIKTAIHFNSNLNM